MVIVQICAMFSNKKTFQGGFQANVLTFNFNNFCFFQDSCMRRPCIKYRCVLMMKAEAGGGDGSSRTHVVATEGSLNTFDRRE
jgi:hypothetical protein